MSELFKTRLGNYCRGLRLYPSISMRVIDLEKSFIVYISPWLLALCKVGLRRFGRRKSMKCFIAFLRFQVERFPFRKICTVLLKRSFLFVWKFHALSKIVFAVFIQVLIPDFNGFVLVFFKIKRMVLLWSRSVYPVQNVTNYQS